MGFVTGTTVGGPAAVTSRPRRARTAAITVSAPYFPDLPRALD